MRRVLSLLVLFVLVAACGNAAENVVEEAVERGIEAESGGDVDVQVDEDSGSVKIETDEGEINIGSGGEVPDELNVPLPDGGTVVGSSVSSGTDEFVLLSMEYPASELEDVVAFFEDYFDDENAFSQQVDSDGIKAWTWASEDQTVTVSVTYNDGDDIVSVGITQSGG